MAEKVLFERREHPRVNVPATAVVNHHGNRARYLVQNLSARGALLTGSCPAPADRNLELELELPGREPLSVRAKVLRRATSDPDLVAVAVAFRDANADAEDAIQQAVLEALERAKANEPFFKDADYYGGE